MKVALIANSTAMMVNFRGTLLASLVSRGHEVYGLAPDRDEERERWLALQGVQFHHYPLERNGREPLQDATATLALVRLLRDIRPDVVLAYTVKPIVYGAVAARLAGVPRSGAVICGLAPGYYNELSPGLTRIKRLQQWLYRIALRSCDTVFFYNPEDREEFWHDRLLPKGAKTMLLDGSGVDLAHFAEAPFVEAPRFLMVARLLRHKGTYEYAAAAARLKRTYPDAQFQLLGPHGDHPDDVAHEDLARWQAEGSVEYLGAATDVRPHLAAASVFVLPSYREGIPRAALEAMAMGRAVISTDVPGCREVVRDGHNGLLVPSRQVTPLADAMARLIRDPAKRRSMGQHSRAMVAERFEVHKVNQRLFGAFGL